MSARLAETCGEGSWGSSRRFAEREEEIWDRERKAQEMGRRHERKVVRRGMFLLS
jgi:hypothetical protein